VPSVPSLASDFPTAISFASSPRGLSSTLNQDKASQPFAAMLDASASARLLRPLAATRPPVRRKPCKQTPAAAPDNSSTGNTPHFSPSSTGGTAKSATSAKLRERHQADRKRKRTGRPGRLRVPTPRPTRHSAANTTLAATPSANTTPERDPGRNKRPGTAPPLNRTLSALPIRRPRSGRSPPRLRIDQSSNCHNGHTGIGRKKAASNAAIPINLTAVQRRQTPTRLPPTRLLFRQRRSRQPSSSIHGRHNAGRNQRVGVKRGDRCANQGAGEPIARRQPDRREHERTRRRQSHRPPMLPRPQQPIPARPTFQAARTPVPRRQQHAAATSACARGQHHRADAAVRRQRPSRRSSPAHRRRPILRRRQRTPVQRLRIVPDRRMHHRQPMPRRPPAPACRISGSTVANAASTQAAPATPGTAIAAAIPVSGVPSPSPRGRRAAQVSFDITLSPPELGRIDVRIDVDSKGQVTSHVTRRTVPRPLSLLQSQQPQIEHALEQAGFEDRR